MAWSAADEVADFVAREADEHAIRRAQHRLDGRLNGGIREVGTRVALDAAEAELGIHFAGHQRDGEPRLAAACEFDPADGGGSGASAVVFLRPL